MLQPYQPPTCYVQLTPDDARMQMAKLSLRTALGAALLAAMLISSCAPALASPPRLIASWPAAGARLTVARHTLELTFNRPLLADSSASVWSEDGSSIASEATLDQADSRHLMVHLLEPAPGAYELHFHAVAADTRMAVDGDEPFVLQDESPTPPRVDVSPASADTGQRVELVGKGFASQSPLRLTIGDNLQALATTETDASGEFSVEAQIPAAVPFGLQPITVTDGDGRTASVGLDVRWGGWPPAVATDVGQAGPQPGQVSFTVEVRNLSDYMLEHVRVVLRDPEGCLLVSADQGAQREDDTLVWLVPVLDRGTAGPFHATYRAPAAAVSHAWLEYRHRHARGCSGDVCLPAFISNSTADSPPTSPAT